MKAIVLTCALAASLVFLPAAAHADLQPSCPAAEYVYAGARLLAVVTPPTVSIGDASLTEGDDFTALMTFSVALSAQSDVTITVNYATGTGGTAAAGFDYAPTSGTLTIPAGAAPPGGYSVSVPIFADRIDEPNETFFVDLTIPGACGPVAPGDMQAQGIIVDNDVPETISIADTQLVEGDEGTHSTGVGVGISESGYTVTVNYATANGTATAPGDYDAKSGTLTFTPGTTVLNIPLSVVADGVPEPNETFYVNLSGATNATITDSQGSLTIFNDDPGFVPSIELAPGAEEFADLRATGAPPTAAAHLYRVGQKPRSSYEVVVDSISGDVDNGFGIRLERYAWDQTTLLDTSTVVPSHSVNRRIRWTNFEFVPVNHQFIKVQSSGCTTNCGADDVYRIRFFDTTYRIPRFNNQAGQITVVILQNTTSNSISVTIDFWSEAGAHLGSTLLGVPSKQTVTVDTTTLMPNVAGSITISNNGSYADLVGKAVSIDPATGMSFDTPMSPRPLR